MNDADISGLCGALYERPDHEALDQLMIAGRQRFQCLALGHRKSIYRPVVLKRRKRADQLHSRYGWPSAFMRDWIREGHAQDFSVNEVHRTDAPVCAWHLEAVRQHASAPMQSCIDFMISHGITAGITVLVPRLNGDRGSLICIYDKSRESLAAKVASEQVADLFYLSSSIIHAVERLEPEGPIPELSPPQVICLRWISEGKTDEEIAAIMDRSVNTVRYHVKATLKALDASNRAHAVALAIRHRIV